MSVGEGRKGYIRAQFEQILGDDAAKDTVCLGIKGQRSAEERIVGEMKASKRNE